MRVRKYETPSTKESFDINRSSCGFYEKVKHTGQTLHTWYCQVIESHSRKSGIDIMLLSPPFDCVLDIFQWDHKIKGDFVYNGSGLERGKQQEVVKDVSLERGLLKHH